MSEITSERPLPETKPALCMHINQWASGKMWICVSPETHTLGEHYYQRLA